MLLPTFDNSTPRDRFDPARSATANSATANSASAETEMPFANLFARREDPAESSNTYKDERNQPATAAVAATEPPAESRPDDTRETEPDEPQQEARPTDTDATEETHKQTAATANPAANPEPADRAQRDSEQVADVPSPAEDPSKSAGSKPALSPTREATTQTPTQPVVDSQSLPSTEASEVPVSPEVPAVLHEGATEGAHSKQKQKRTSLEAGNNDKATRNPASGKGHPSPQAVTGATIAADAVGELVGNTAEQPATAGPRGNEANSETAELRTPTDPNARTTAPGDRTAEQMLTRASARSEGNPELSQVDRTRLIQRVARAIHTAPLRGGIIRLRLRPPELGSLHLEVSMEKGGLTARLEAETQTARSLLLEHLPQLRQRLAEQGVRIERFDVDVSQQDTGQSQQQADLGHDRSADPGLRPNRSQSEEATDNRANVPEVTRIINQRNLNVVI